jgi:hypothetical protein
VPQALNGLAKRWLRVKTDLPMVDETIIQFRGDSRPQPRKDETGDASSHGEEVMFDRHELSAILSLYGRMVAAGEWRDYAIGSGREHAVFAVFRHTAEMPLYRIEKHPRLRNRQGMYAVVASGGMILKRGHELAQVLRVLEPRRPHGVDQGPSVCR